MKKFFVIAAMAAVALSSCLKETPGTGKRFRDGGEADLFIKVESPALDSDRSRAIQGPGVSTVGTIQFLPNALYKGLIFIADGFGNKIRVAELLAAAKTSPDGQAAGTVTTGNTVYILANISTADFTTISAMNNIAEVKAYAADITTVNDYTLVVLANADGNPAPVGEPAAEGEPVTVTIPISPVISRIELHKLTANTVDGGTTDQTNPAYTGGVVTEFTIKGVYLDSYYKKYTYGGSFYDTSDHMDPVSSTNPTKFEQGSSETFAGIKDEGSWVAANVAGVMTATADIIGTSAISEVWAHNVAAESCPRFVIAVNNIKFIPSGASDPQTIAETRYITVAGYDGVTSFERGKIYRITDLKFSPKDLKLVPNPSEVNMVVKVTIQEWALEDLTVQLP